MGKGIFLTTLLTAFICFTPLQAQQRGKASFYSKKATGARTSSGQKLHHDSLTCAHRTYPFGSILKVKNPANGKVVYVKVNDRGPFRKGRIIDLSWRAAQELGIISQGVALVEVELANKSQVPLKSDNKISLPELDLGMMNSGYDYKNWWYDNTDYTKTPTIKTSRLGQATTSKNRNKPNSTSGNKNTNTKNEKSKPNKNEKSEHGTISNMLDKIKGWGEDLFNKDK